MRLSDCAVLLALCTPGAGCGGGPGAADGAVAPENGSLAGQLPEGGTTVGGNAEAATTTLGGLTAGDAGPGTKLSGAPSPSAPGRSGSASAPATAPAARTHDPGRAPSDVRSAVLAHRAEARECYDRALPEHPKMEGDLTIVWTIDPSGNVTRVSADPSRSQIGDPVVVKCVAGVISQLKFPASQGGFETHAAFPFNFHPSGLVPSAQRMDAGR